MLNKELVIIKLREIAINFSLEVKKEYLKFIYDKLVENGVSQKIFIRYANRILLKENTLFNKMPPLAMFINPILDEEEERLQRIENEKENTKFLEEERKKRRLNNG